ncbi:acyltransferase family protein [Agromyces atrinae]|uniref:acyltransferase family protein n=1 Tax=Agromyces atrinae TaxID=592376 RepID=UPI001F5ACB6D|nr:acyltransferase family protein [Agromyces atrinae]MCI2958004.1 acyltransferase family protein [Agromyces atrinae]
MTASTRLDWIDIAKAAAIVLIVLFHTTDWFLDALLPGSQGAVVRLWNDVSISLIPVRIPLFFLVSGLLAVSALERPWRTLTVTRFLALLWPFFVWTLLVMPFWMLRASYDDPLAILPLAVSTLFFAGAHYWYLPALIVALIIAKLTRRLPLTTLVAAALLAFNTRTVLEPLVGVLPTILGINLERWFTFTFWFLVGCFARPVIERIAAWPRWAAFVAVAGFGGLIAVQKTVGVLALTTALVSVVGIVAAILLSAWASRSAAVVRVGRYLAARTLPIYVGHAFLFEVVAVIAESSRRAGFAPSIGNTVTGVLVIPIVVIAAVAASAALYDASRRWNFAWLYEPPARLRTRLGYWAAHHASR